MDALGRGVTATLGLFDIHFWYVIFGTLIAAWTFFLLAAAIVRRYELATYIFGAVIFLAIEWFGFAGVYNAANGRIQMFQIASLIIPVALLVSQVIIFVIIAKYRSKQTSLHLVCEKQSADIPEKVKTKRKSADTQNTKAPSQETVDEKPNNELESKDG